MGQPNQFASQQPGQPGFQPMPFMSPQQPPQMMNPMMMNNQGYYNTGMPGNMGGMPNMGMNPGMGMPNMGMHPGMGGMNPGMNPAMMGGQGMYNQQ